MNAAQEQKQKHVSKERPILFSGEMVRAILDGRKTQTRRVLKPQPHTPTPGTYADRYDKTDCWAFWLPDLRMTEPKTWACPYGRPGDQLWVKETFALETDFNVGMLGYEPPHKDGRPVNRIDDSTFGLYWEQAHYRATDPEPELCYEDWEDPEVKWRPSIYMPRWASRIMLELTEVRVERLREISEDDATAEAPPRLITYRTAIDAFSNLWDSINAKRGWGWNQNPWVWVIEFRRV